MYSCQNSANCTLQADAIYCTNLILQQSGLKSLSGDVPGGGVGRNSPANAGDMGPIPGLGRCHMLWGQ